MYEYLRGRVAARDAAGLVVEANGIGYRIRVSTRWTPNAGADVKVYVHEHATDQGVELYGFDSIEDRNLFRTLLDVRGVGPRGALSVLSGTTREEFLQALASRDARALTRIKGIGKKTSERILVELGDRLAKLQVEAGGGSPMGGASDRPLDTCVAALSALGVPRERALEATQKAIDGLGRPPVAEDVESLVRQALRNI